MTEQKVKVMIEDIKAIIKPEVCIEAKIEPKIEATIEATIEPKIEAYIKANEPKIDVYLSKVKEVQSHGFIWEEEISINVYGVKKEELEKLKYTRKIDIPANLNRLDKCDVHVKTTCSLNCVCMADCLSLFDVVNSGKPIHLVVIYYIQDSKNNTKTVLTITEVDLTDSLNLLFGSLTRCQIEELDKVVKSVPQKKKPTEEEYKKMYSLRDSLHKLSGAIHLDIKYNSTQSRLQCSFNRFQQFVEKNPSKIVHKSNTNEFRGNAISYHITSGRRIFKKKEKIQEKNK